MFRSIIVTLLAASAVSPAMANPQHEAWNRARTPFQIIGNTWYVGTQGLSMLLIRGEHGAVLIDAGLPESGANLRNSLAALDVAPAEIKLILTSHAHVDHVGALAELKALTGARVLASPESATVLAAAGKGDLHFGDSMTYSPVVVDGTIVDGETVTLGELSLTAHLTPGHTPGSTSWSWEERVGERTLDVVYADSITAPGYRLLDHPKLPRLVDDYHRTFAKLRTMPCDVLITPHPDASDLFARVEQEVRKDAQSKQGARLINNKMIETKLIDSKACTRYADRADQALDEQIMQQRAGLQDTAAL